MLTISEEKSLASRSREPINSGSNHNTPPIVEGVRVYLCEGVEQLKLSVEEEENNEEEEEEEGEGRMMKRRRNDHGAIASTYFWCMHIQEQAVFTSSYFVRTEFHLQRRFSINCGVSGPAPGFRVFSDLYPELLAPSRCVLVVEQLFRWGSWSGEIWAALNNEALKVNECEANTGIPWWGKLEISEKTCQPAASSAMIPTCENPRAIPLGIKSCSPWWEASALSSTPFGHVMLDPAEEESLSDGSMRSSAYKYASEPGSPCSVPDVRQCWQPGEGDEVIMRTPIPNLCIRPRHVQVTRAPSKWGHSGFGARASSKWGHSDSVASAPLKWEHSSSVSRESHKCGQIGSMVRTPCKWGDFDSVAGTPHGATFAMWLEHHHSGATVAQGLEHSTSRVKVAQWLEHTPSGVTVAQWLEHP
ncbi:hypothetical protein PR048_021033 [Dryococelus australis]|uniref:Uncharacterized protein n=1 Tax=Dryococelus australis TaxID=614101 RepID=A0ABQ9GX30_9NEOP|nr:hypothetical protein PR048_021033 [Dryococelus australis]